MQRLALFLAITLVPILSVAQSSTTTPKFAVGGCEPKLTSFNTISQAVSTVPPSSTILVCPGNYPEQVVITQPLTLQGVLIGGSGAAVITVPSGGLSTSVSPGSGGSVSAFLAVENTGPVNINDIAVDGSGGSTGGCNVVGMYYLSSSGTINHVAVRNVISGGFCGDAIWAENDNSTSSSTVTVQNSTLNGFDGVGANVLSGPGAVNSVINIQSNSIAGTSRTDGAGIVIFQAVGGTVSGNTVDNVSTGIVLQGTPSTAKSNRVSNTNGAVVVASAGNTVQSNTIFNSSGIAVQVLANTNQIVSNSFFSVGTGIGLFCNLATSGNIVTGNTVNNAGTGIQNNGITGNTVAPNSYFNTTTAVGPCI